MKKNTKPSGQKIKLSPGELELLELLWSCGPLTIAGAHEVFQQRGRKIGYPTVQTRLNRLAEKGIVRKNGQYPARYEAVLKESDISGQYYDLLDDLCGGNITPLMLHLVGKRDLQPSELYALKKILQEQETKAREK